MNERKVAEYRDILNKILIAQDDVFNALKKIHSTVFNIYPIHNQRISDAIDNCEKHNVLVKSSCDDFINSLRYDEKDCMDKLAVFYNKCDESTLINNACHKLIISFYDRIDSSIATA